MHFEIQFPLDFFAKQVKFDWEFMNSNWKKKAPWYRMMTGIIQCRPAGWYAMPPVGKFEED